MKIIAWRNHFYDPGLTKEVAEAAQELDTEKRIDLYHTIQQQSWDRSPIAFILQLSLCYAKMSPASSSGRSPTSFVMGRPARRETSPYSPAERER